MSKKSTEDKIIDSAIRIFSEKGYNGTSTSEIAKSAGVAEGTIFRYFPSKKSLLIKIGTIVMETIGDTMIIGPIEKIINDNEGAPMEIVLKKIIVNRIELLTNHSDKLGILLSEAKYHEELREIFQEIIISKILKVMLPLIEDMKKSYELRDIDNIVIARAFVGTVGMLGIQRIYLPNLLNYTLEEEMDLVIDMLINGLKKR